VTRHEGGEILDKFEEMMKMMSDMTEKERMKAIADNKALCICPDCPTYNECAQKKGEAFYCALGRSPTCITKEAGCICAACPITEKVGLINEYFCTKGSEKEQRGM
jgi:hypothetical protein